MKAKSKVGIVKQMLGHNIQGPDSNLFCLGQQLSYSVFPYAEL